MIILECDVFSLHVTVDVLQIDKNWMIAPFDELNDVEQLKTKAFKSPVEVRVIVLRFLMLI